MKLVPSGERAARGMQDAKESVILVVVVITPSAVSDATTRGTLDAGHDPPCVPPAG